MFCDQIPNFHPVFFPTQQMDNAVYTFEQLLYQNMAEQSGEELIKNIHRSQDRVLKVSQPETFLNKSNARNLCSIQRVLILSYLFIYE